MILLNGALTSGSFTKYGSNRTRLPRRRIQPTLQVQNTVTVGFDLRTFYKPFRDVGGDYFDVIALPHDRTLFAVADVSGKGVPAALLAANIQALIRSIASIDADPLTMARRINSHLSRYTPADRFATAVFMVLSQDSGRIALRECRSQRPCHFMFRNNNISGIHRSAALGSLPRQSMNLVLPLSSRLGLSFYSPIDSIAAKNPEECLRDVLADSSNSKMTRLKSLIDPELNLDDVTILLLGRPVFSNPEAGDDASRLQ